MFSHQRRIPKGIRKAFLSSMQKLKELDFIKANYFDGILKIVKKCKVKGIGDLTVYDTSLRIAFYFSRKRNNVLPTNVYLHAGALIGANTLIKKGYLNNYHKVGDEKIACKKDFCKAIRVLKAYEIEDFLCIFKNEFKKLNKVK